MEMLPDDVWRRIFEIGVESSIITSKALCCLSMSCKRFDRLSNEDSLWWALLTIDFPQDVLVSSNISGNPSKFLYRTRFERDRAKRAAACEREASRVRRAHADEKKNLNEWQLLYEKEVENKKATMAELMNLNKIRQSSVTTFNLWQPGKQKKFIDECLVPGEQRIWALEMELKSCKCQITVCNEAMEEHEQKLGESKKKMAYLMYHPLRDCSEYLVKGGGIFLKRRRIEPAMLLSVCLIGGRVFPLEICWMELYESLSCIISLHTLLLIFLLLGFSDKAIEEWRNRNKRQAVTVIPQKSNVFN